MAKLSKAEIAEAVAEAREQMRVWMQFGRGMEDVGNPDGPNPVIACSADEDMARQEYALSADLKYQVQRFGVGRPMDVGAVDFDNLDLTTAFALIEEAQARWDALPRVIRDRYQSWGAVEAAAQSGELQQVLKAAGVPEVPSGVPGASASDSAPVEGVKPV